MDYRGVLTEYTGYQMSDILKLADPEPDADTLLLQASDGYAFLLSFEEIENNQNILFIQNGTGKMHLMTSSGQNPVKHGSEILKN